MFAVKDLCDTTDDARLRTLCYGWTVRWRIVRMCVCGATGPHVMNMCGGRRVLVVNDACARCAVYVRGGNVGWVGWLDVYGSVYLPAHRRFCICVCQHFCLCACLCVFMYTHTHARARAHKHAHTHARESCKSDCDPVVLFKVCVCVCVCTGRGHASVHG